MEGAKEVTSAVHVGDEVWVKPVGRGVQHSGRWEG